MSDQRDRAVHVISVQDDAEVAETTARGLERVADSLSVDTAPTPQAGLEHLDSGHFDCVLSAYQLPEMDGVEFLEVVRKRHGSLPFVLYTANGSEALASEAIAAGVTHYCKRGATGDQYQRLADRITASVADWRADSPNYASTVENKANLLDQLFEQLPVSLYVKDREGRHLYMSEYDVPPADVLGKTDREIYGDDAFAREAAADDLAVIETGEPIINKEEYNEQNDEWTLTSKVPWYGQDGAIKGLIGVTRFITEKKEYEREIQHKNERLEKFASVLSHDLRNPLHVAIGNVELLREDFEDSRLERVATALDRMDDLIADILELARQGEAAIEPEPVSLAALVREAWTTVETSGADLEFTGDLRFYGDRQRVLELFENLLCNAVEHADPETITVGPLSDETGFYIADDGPGIPDARTEEIFQPGFTTGADGTGFGLAIVSEVAEAHGWDIDVTDSESGGARFEITGLESP